jgi:hypothetical protein
MLRFVGYRELRGQLKLDRTQGTLVGVAGLVQVLLTVAGAASGGLSALVVNEKPLALAGLIALFVAVLIGALLAVAAFHTRAKLLGLVAVVLFTGGMAITAYAAIVAPNKLSQPEISVELQKGNPLVLSGTVNASGVKRQVSLNVYVDGLYEQGGKYTFTSPALYQAHIGADSKGDVKHAFTVLIPSNTYDALAIDAWTGKKTVCSPPTGGSDISPGHKACVFLRLVGVGGRPPQSPPRPDESVENKVSGASELLQPAAPAPPARVPPYSSGAEAAPGR